MAGRHGQSSSSTYDVEVPLQDRAENRLPQTPAVETHELVAKVGPVPQTASRTCEVASNTTCRYVRYSYMLYIPT